MAGPRLARVAAGGEGRSSVPWGEELRASRGKSGWRRACAWRARGLVGRGEVARAMGGGPRPAAVVEDLMRSVEEGGKRAMG